MTHAERSHTRLRLKERYGWQATSAEVFEMAKLMAHGHGTLLARQSRDVVHWLLPYKGLPLRLVFDRRRRSIITALPPLATPPSPSALPEAPRP